jgi:hypothetical protein
MKKLSLVLSLMIAVNVNAAFDSATCSSIQGTPHQITLVMANQNLLQVRFRAGTRSKALMVTKLPDQNAEGVTIYNVNGVVSLMEVDNQILSGNGGIVKFSNDEFSCL